MRDARITDVNFAPQDERLRLDVIGYPSECMEMANQICLAVYGTKEWAFISIEGKRQSHAELPSDFQMKIVAERVLGV